MPRNTETTQEAKTFVPKDEYQKIVDAADAEGVSVAEYMRRALRVRLTAQNVKGAPLQIQHGGSRTEPDALPVSRTVADGEHSGLLCVETAKTP